MASSALRRRHVAQAVSDWPDVADETHPLTEYRRFDNEQHVLLDQTQAALTSRARTTFDIHRPGHLAALFNLWSHAFPGVPFPEGRRSPRWAELGFQGLDPVSDLRGCGHLGLLQLIHALTNCGPRYRESLMVGEDFPVALASLSCTAMLCRYLSLDRTLIVPGADEHEATPAVVRSLLRLQVSGAHGHDVLTVLHLRLLRHLANVWRRMDDHEAKIMSFHVALRATYAHLHWALHGAAQPLRLDALVERFESHGVAHDISGQLGRATLLAFLWQFAVRLGCASDDKLRRAMIE